MSNHATEWTTTVQLKLDRDDTELLEACCAAEKLPKVEILRRSLRRFASETLERKSSPEVTRESSVA